MIIFCNPSCLNLNGIEGKIFNLLSISSLGVRLNNLMPPFNTFMYNEDNLGFDIDYYNFIMNNDLAFIDLMRIMYNEYENGIDCATIILIDNDEFRDVIRDSLIKLIQQRYGINSFIVNEFDDWNYLESSQSTNFDINGIYNFDYDKERYSVLNFDELNFQVEQCHE